MINKIIRLVGVKQFDTFYEELVIPNDKLLIKPDYLSICAADLRYYTGQRNRNVLKKKLPLSLIHEAIGTVLVDPLGKIGVGKKVIMIPNTNISCEDTVKGNYQSCSKFRSSDIDGFMQEFVVCEYDRVIPFDTVNDVETFVLCELISVAVNAVTNSLEHIKSKCNKIGIWGDGNLGFVTMLVVKKFFPDSKIYIFGHNSRKSLHFIMADEVYDTENISDDIMVDCAFECVGGINSRYAIQQIINLIKPQGCISLLGVSEEPVPINTRQILEKGLMLLGNSRSEKCDFEEAVRLVDNNYDIRTHLKTMISEVKRVKNMADIYYSFENAQINDFKTIMNWRI